MPARRTPAVPPDPYVWALQALGRREYTTRQLEERLGRRGCAPDAVAEALARLRREGLLDDARAARAYARTEALVKRRGPERIKRALGAMGVPPEAARQALAEGFEERSVDEALEQALQRKIRGPVTDLREERRLIGYLVRQGFAPGAASTAVRRRRKDTTP